LTIDADKLKDIQGIDIKRFKHKDITSVCSQLNIKGVKNATKEANDQQIIVL